MNQLVSTIVLGCGLVLAGSAITEARSENRIKENAVVCITKSGVEATRADMNVKQLQSLGCATASTSLRFDVLPPSAACDPYLFVAATFPDRILRYWIRRDQLDDPLLNFAGDLVSCKD